MYYIIWFDNGDYYYLFKLKGEIKKKYEKSEMRTLEGRKERCGSEWVRRWRVVWAAEKQKRWAWDIAAMPEINGGFEFAIMNWIWEMRMGKTLQLQVGVDSSKLRPLSNWFGRSNKLFYIEKKTAGSK
jgi:hypothetical protein